MSHCAPETTLKPIRFQFMLKLLYDLHTVVI